MDEYDVAVHHGIYKHGLLLREFYQLPLQKGLKVKEVPRRIMKEASRRIKKEEKEKKHQNEKKEKKKPTAFRVVRNRCKGSVATAKQVDIGQYVDVEREKGRDIQHTTPKEKR